VKKKKKQKEGEGEGEEEIMTMIIIICFSPGSVTTLQHIKVGNQIHAPAALRWRMKYRDIRTLNLIAVTGGETL
jgi:hypothetical protein